MEIKRSERVLLGALIFLIIGNGLILLFWTDSEYGSAIWQLRRVLTENPVSQAMIFIFYEGLTFLSAPACLINFIFSVYKLVKTDHQYEPINGSQWAYLAASLAAFLISAAAFKTILTIFFWST